MTLSPTIINGLLIGGMIIVLLLIFGVLGALAGSRKAVAPVPQWADVDGFDLEGRLHHLGGAKAGAGSTSAALDDPVDGAAPAVIGTRSTAPSRSVRTAQSTPATPPRGGAAAPPSTRLALPTSGTVKIPAPAPVDANPGQGLNPLAARFSSLDHTSTGHDVAPATNQTPRQSALPGTNGLAPFTSMTNHAADHGARNGGAPRVTGGLAAEQVERSSASAAMASRFTEAPQPQARPAPRPSLPPSEQHVTRELPPSHQGPTHRLELPGTVAREDPAAGMGRHGASLDLHSLLRGETPATRPSAAAPTAGASSAGAPARPRFTSGPLSPAADGAPAGAVPFDPNLLHVRPPVQPSMSAESARPNGAKSLPPLPANGAAPAPNDTARAASDVPGSGNGHAGSSDFVTALSYGALSAERERVPLIDPLADFDATRLVGDFDLPDTGFETHVFSTTELLGDAPLGTMSYPSVVGAMPDTAPVSFDSGPLSEPVPATPAAFPVAVLAQLQPPIDELAALLDVSFVRLIGAGGTSLLAGGTHEASPPADRAIAALLTTAIMEGQQLDLGACSTLSVEAPAAALLLSPLPGGLCLAVLLGNPTRLGLLRRQVRKPLAALRATLVEHGLS